jgi:hypothetical protein
MARDSDALLLLLLVLVVHTKWINARHSLKY